MPKRSAIAISVVIPTCDRSGLLAESLGSVFAQTRQPNEIIVVNNSVGALNLPKNIADKITVYTMMPYAGVAQARNFGACLAKHEYLAFLDDDDLWSVNYLEQIAKAFERNETCVISRLDKLADGNISGYKNAAGLLSIQNILRFNPGITGSNIALTKTAFFAVGGFDPNLPPSEDKALVLELICRGAEVTVLPENAATHRMHAGNRLSDNARLAEGIFQFTHKYRSRMSLSDFLFNRYKYFKYRYRSGQRHALVGFVFFSALYKSAALFAKTKI